MTIEPLKPRGVVGHLTYFLDDGSKITNIYRCFEDFTAAARLAKTKAQNHEIKGFKYTACVGQPRPKI